MGSLPSCILQASTSNTSHSLSLHLQAHYQAAAAERLDALRREYGHDVALLQAVLAREGAVLAQAQEAAIRGELAAFVDGCLPALADVLASKRLLLRCFELLAEQESEDEDEED